MTGWTAKRFWKEATVEACDGGFTVRLDQRPVKTPAKSPLVVPSEALAAEIAAEWDAQSGTIKPDLMPMTRAANSAIDKVGPLFEAVVDEIAGFGGSDLLCYRAVEPAELINRQKVGWDPLLDWVTAEYGVTLKTTNGVMPVDQPAESLARLRAAVASHSVFRLVALHDLVAITGSLVLGLAIGRGRLEPDTAFALSRIDEHWQIEQWGEDEAAAEAEAARLQSLRNAGRFYALCG